MPYLTAVQGQIKLGKFLGCVIFGRVWQVWYMVCGQVKVKGGGLAGMVYGMWSSEGKGGGLAGMVYGMWSSEGKGEVWQAADEC